MENREGYIPPAESTTADEPEVTRKKGKYGKKLAVPFIAATLGLTGYAIGEITSESSNPSISQSAEGVHYSLDAESARREVAMSSLKTNPKSFGLGDKYDVSEKSYFHFSNVKTEKFRNGSEKNDIVEVIPLLRVKQNAAGVSELIDVSASGMDEDTIAWMQKRFGKMKGLLDAGFAAGALKEIVVGTQPVNDKNSDDGSHYNTEKKTVLVDINFATQPELIPELIDASVEHEVGHALFAERPISSLNTEIAKGPEAEQLQKACAAVRKHSIEELEDNLSEYKHLLNKVGKLNVRYEPIADALIKAAYANDLDQYYPKKRGALNSYTETPSCEFMDFNQLFGRVKDKLAINFEGMPKPQKKNEEKRYRVMDDLNSIGQAIIRKSAVYTAFTDETFTDNKDTGHPKDSLDESAASFLMLTDLYPKELGEEIFSLPADQGEAVWRYYNGIMGEYKKVNPKLATWLDTKMPLVKENAMPS